MSRRASVPARRSWTLGIGVALVLAWIVSSPWLQQPARAGESFFDSPFDGVWAGSVQVKSDTGTRGYPLLLNLDADATGVRGVVLVADDLRGNPSSMRFRPLLSAQARGKKVDLRVGAGGDDTHRLVLRSKRGLLKGKLTSSVAGIGSSKVVLSPLDPDLALQQVWVGSFAAASRTGAAQETLVALALTQGSRLSGVGLVGSAFGALRNAVLAGDRLTTTLATDAGDIAVAVQRSGGMLAGSLLGAGFDGQVTLHAAGMAAGDPVLKKAKVASLPAGKVTNVQLRGKNFADGFLVHTDHAGVYASVPEVTSSKVATVALFVPEATEPGTEITLRVVSASGSSSDLRKPLRTAGQAPVSYLADIQPIFANICAQPGCHATPDVNDPIYGDDDGPAGDLALDPNLAYGNIVNKPSSERPELDRVEPGDPARSYLYLKLRGDPTIIGERMPKGGPFLSDAQIELFRKWILAGALRN